MPTATPEEVSSQQYYEELNRLFLLYRLANLNTRYYGRRAEKFESQKKWVDISVAFLSTVALTVVLAVEGTIGKIIAASLSGIAAIISGVTPFLGITDKIRDLRGLRFAYSQLFGQIEFVITEIRRAGQVSEQHIGLSRMVLEAYTRIEALDEMDPDKALIDEEDAKVRAAFPDDYLWTNF